MNSEMRSRLLEQETRNDAFERRFRQEVKSMTERKLTLRNRVSWVVAGLLGLFFTVWFGYAAWSAPSDFPPLGRLAFVLGAVFGMGWVGISARILRKGSFSIKTDENLTHGLTWGFMVLMMTAFLVIGARMEDRVQGISMGLNGLVFFVAFAIPAFIGMRTNRLELSVREQLLRMEITLERIAGNQSPEETATPRTAIHLDRERGDGGA